MSTLLTVRLDGPVNGRSAVRRDLAQDLMRIWQTGVRCIVWYAGRICIAFWNNLIARFGLSCLDDSELEYLGAPWPEYCRIADEIGIDVLRYVVMNPIITIEQTERIVPVFPRLPTPEGLTPLDPSILDDHLTRLIKSYTLSGQHVLVHCRGGVGRAGLVACCWMLKLGLCGWADDILAPGNSCEIEGTGLRRDTLLLVEKALWTVRRRRSPKAVETYEQVKFLVDFVDYLRGDRDTDPNSVGSDRVAESPSSRVIDSVLDPDESTWKGTGENVKFLAK